VTVWLLRISSRGCNLAALLFYRRILRSSRRLLFMHSPQDPITPNYRFSALRRAVVVDGQHDVSPRRPDALSQVGCDRNQRILGNRKRRVFDPVLVARLLQTGFVLDRYAVVTLNFQVQVNFGPAPVLNRETGEPAGTQERRSPCVIWRRE